MPDPVSETYHYRKRPERKIGRLGIRQRTIGPEYVEDFGVYKIGIRYQVSGIRYQVSGIGCTDDIILTLAIPDSYSYLYYYLQAVSNGV